MGEAPEKGDTYKKGDRVFSKLKGFPWWPSQIQERVQGKEEKYFLHFYGTYDSAQVKLSAITPYTIESINKYGKMSKPSHLFKKAMEEIEANVEIYEQKNEPTEPEPEPLDSAEEGELRIDETPPPILKREGKLPTPKSTPKEQPQPKAPPRRPSKASRKDSIGSLSGAASPVNETPPTVPQEITSRSGRKIKPKRFADDEIGSPVSMLAKAALQSSFEESKANSGPPSAKRAKRQKPGSSPAPALTPVTSTPSLPEPIPPKPTKIEQQQTPKVKTTVKSTSQPKTLKTLSPTKPSLTPIQPLHLPEKAESPSLSLPEIESEGDTPALLRPDEEETFEDDMGEEVNDNGEDVEDKENSTGSWVNHHVREDSASDDSSSCRNENIKVFTEIPVSPDESSGEPFKVSCMKKDTEAEIFFNPKKAQELRSARVEWDMESAKLCLKLRHTLEGIEPAAIELFNLLADTVAKKEDEMRGLLEKTMRDKRAEKLRILRLEGEVIEIIGDIINSLNAKCADCYHAIELLDRLANHKLNTLILKKHPEVVETIRKLRYYEGNAETWDLGPEELEEFNEKAFIIREKAREIYDSFKLLFCSSPDKSFRLCYEEEMEKFKEYCNSISQTDFLHMTEEPTSEGVAEGEELEGENGDIEGIEEEMGGEQGEEPEDEEHLENEIEDEDADMEIAEDEEGLLLDDNGQIHESEPET